MTARPIMRSSRLLLQPYFKGLANPRPCLSAWSIEALRPQARHSHSFSIATAAIIQRPGFQHRHKPSVSSEAANPLAICAYVRHFSTSRVHRQESARDKEESQQLKPIEQEQNKKPEESAKAAEHDLDELDHEAEERGFGRSEKAAQASQVNLSARLSKEPKDAGKGMGLQETWRLIKIARPEAGVLGWAFLFLLVSSSISMTIPFSIGKFLDVATNAESGSPQLYGFELSTLYMALAGILVVGASANYGRILILRIVGERIVARLRSQLFQRTYAQNAEFFDANRVGDLISRLSSDTVIVGKSITQNLSDGLRSLVSGVAGLTLMAYVSLKLTSILAICFPPVAVGTVIFGRMMRNLSRNIQKNLGTLTKIAEERLGNVRTSQSFAGEILEVSRYNAQVKKIFALGKREAFITAIYFSSVGLYIII